MAMQPGLCYSAVDSRQVVAAREVDQRSWQRMGAIEKPQNLGGYGQISPCLLPTGQAESCTGSARPSIPAAMRAAAGRPRGEDKADEALPLVPIFPSLARPSLELARARDQTTGRRRSPLAPPLPATPRPSEHAKSSASPPSNLPVEGIVWGALESPPPSPSSSRPAKLPATADSPCGLLRPRCLALHAPGEQGFLLSPSSSSLPLSVAAAHPCPAARLLPPARPLRRPFPGGAGTIGTAAPGARPNAPGRPTRAPRSRRAAHPWRRSAVVGPFVRD
nr:uncharacterized protein LOC127339732 [Lolium perenne]